MEEDGSMEVARPQTSEVTQLQRRLHEEVDQRRKNATLPSHYSADTDLLWRRCPSLKSGVRPHLVMLGNSVYVGGGGGGDFETCRRVQKYVYGSDKWDALPITPYTTFALSSFNGHATVVGGVNVVSSLASGDLIYFDESVKRWKKTLPPMLTKRYALSATSLAGYLVVTGGIAGDGKTYLDTVEVLDTEGLSWSSAASLPKPTTFMSITSCPYTGRIYLLGGLTKDGPLRSIFSCEINNLIESFSPKNRVPSDKTMDGGTSKDKVWEVISEAPYNRMGCIAINGKLLVASGLDKKEKTTTSIFVLHPGTRLWEKMGDMATARSSCSLASLVDGRLMVVGGYVDPRHWYTSLTCDVTECINLYIR